MAGIRRFFLISLILIASGGVVAGYWSYQLAQQELHLTGAPELLEIKRGDHAKSILNDLAQRGWLTQAVTPSYFASRVWARPEGLQAGVYQVRDGQSLFELWQQLRQGDQYQFSIALIEGQTLAQWLTAIGAHPYLAGTEELRSGGELVTKVTGSDQLNSLEGYLAPDTYHFYAGTAALKLLRTAYTAQQQRLLDAWQQRADDLPYATPYELLIMASIIEKETGLGSERDLVSSVFVNRLNTGMRLQSDPTTIYGIDNFDGNLTRAHLRETTAYNTYRIDGLPPTPIAMPSQASLIAAAQPATSPYFYFVADGSGGHVFSETLTEHNRAVNRYQRGKH
ncbi:endolytic transglycosylase MltG [Pseudidiomarina halophila]|uniref:endolytic transglycosylase MltG n=1 Tax=Pseudidiomarina halophila TaxID=1449799 RepID=UPI001300280E|nr:endolytic transglycosylase MltG [Pseudidiomarina halophila]